jgi:ferredoxin-nitrite reductase
MSAQDFTDEQRRYLEGFVAGVQARRASQGLKPLGAEGGAAAWLRLPGPTRTTSPPWPASRRRKKLPAEEKAKWRRAPLDATPASRARAMASSRRASTISAGAHGLFTWRRRRFYMCRLRIPNGILALVSPLGIADLAEHGGGYARDDARQSAVRDDAGWRVSLEGLTGPGITTGGRRRQYPQPASPTAASTRRSCRHPSPRQCLAPPQS